jgi:hypothetical protein
MDGLSLLTLIGSKVNTKAHEWLLFSAYICLLQINDD